MEDFAVGLYMSVVPHKGRLSPVPKSRDNKNFPNLTAGVTPNRPVLGAAAETQDRRFPAGAAGNETRGAACGLSGQYPSPFRSALCDSAEDLQGGYSIFRKMSESTKDSRKWIQCFRSFFCWAMRVAEPLAVRCLVSFLELP